jgi:ankyrin repeat protein
MDKNGCTALHIAALYGHELLSGTLLMFQADPGKRGYEGTTLDIN